MITNTDIKKQFIPSTPTTVFPFDVAYFDETNVNVTIITGDVSSALILNADTNGFTVEPVNNDSMSGATITTTESYTTGDIVSIYRATPVTQLNEFQRGSDLPPEVLNSSLDRGVAISQEISDGISRSITFPITDPEGLNYETPTVSIRRNTVLGFDDVGGVRTREVDTDISSVSGDSIPTSVAVKTYVDDNEYKSNMVYESTSDFDASSFLNPTPTNEKFNDSTGIEAISARITPSKSPCLMVIDVTVVYSTRTTNSVLGIFDGSLGGDAIATVSTTHDATGVLTTQTMRYVDEVTTSNPRPYKVKVGGSGGFAGAGATTISINGTLVAGETAFGGTATTSITVQEFPVDIPI